LFSQLDRLTKSIENVQKDINSRYPYTEISPGKIRLIFIK